MGPKAKVKREASSTWSASKIGALVFGAISVIGCCMIVALTAVVGVAVAGILYYAHSVNNVYVGTVNRFLDAVERGNYERAYNELTQAEQGRYGSPEGLRTKLEAAGIVLVEWSVSHHPGHYWQYSGDYRTRDGMVGTLWFQIAPGGEPGFLVDSWYFDRSPASATPTQAISTRMRGQVSAW